MAQSDNQEVFICFEGKYHAESVPKALGYYETLSELVTHQPGFVSQTPFVSVDQDNAQVLYVKFDNAEHLHAWKNLPIHLGIQWDGRHEMFVDYRLRIGNEALGSGPEEGDSDQITLSTGQYLLLWQYPRHPNETDDMCGHMATMVPSAPPAVWQGLVDAATYKSDTEMLRISSWATRRIGLMVKDSIPRVDGDGLNLIRVERDYGKYQRQGAPSDATRCQNAAHEHDKEGLKRC
ncbi:uncharacterized protein LTR77_009364 [Saxophila tyrrhenica]|uniref:Uncharacterized protein n=1 Tax=Saxophila tyrrhenica TaxID=1690608 RepID=A0AAV9NZ77_9PEZI|nr:hypothetical protein LTR77_009364 [Saxophila tyrrhenica]